MSWQHWMLLAAFMAAFGRPVKADDFDYKCRLLAEAVKPKQCRMIAAK